MNFLQLRIHLLKKHFGGLKTHYKTTYKDYEEKNTFTWFSVIAFILLIWGIPNFINYWSMGFNGYHELAGKVCLSIAGLLTVILYGVCLNDKDLPPVINILFWFNIIRKVSQGFKGYKEEAKDTWKGENLSKVYNVAIVEHTRDSIHQRIDISRGKVKRRRAETLVHLQKLNRIIDSKLIIKDEQVEILTKLRDDIRKQSNELDGIIRKLNKYEFIVSAKANEDIHAVHIKVILEEVKNSFQFNALNKVFIEDIGNELKTVEAEVKAIESKTGGLFELGNKISELSEKAALENKQTT